MEDRIELEQRLVSGRNFVVAICGVIGMLLVWSGLGVAFFGEGILGLSDAEQAAAPGDFRIRVGSWAMLLLPWLFLPWLFFVRGKRIVLDSDGICVFARYPRPLAWLGEEWSIRWGEIRQVSWNVPGSYVLASRIVLHAAGRTRRITPWQWVAANSDGHSMFTRDAGDPEKAHRLLNASALVQWIKKHRPDLAVELSVPSGGGRGGAAISDVTPATGSIAFGFIALVFYFVADIYFLATEYYVEGAPLVLLVTSGVLGGVVALIVLKVFEPRRKDILVYSLLFGFGVGLAMHPFLVRVNTWTDAAGLKHYDYRLDRDLVWRSPGMPDLTVYSNTSDWWRTFQPGDSYSFELRKGGLGLWQVNMAPVYEAQKEFYERGRGR